MKRTCAHSRVGCVTSRRVTIVDLTLRVRMHHAERDAYGPVSLHARRRADSRRGATAVEAAIVLPVFLLIVLGALDLGIAVFHDNTLSAAARRGARQAIVHGALAAPQAISWGPTSYAGTAADASAIAQAIRPSLFTFDPSQVQINVDWLDGGNQPDQRVRVTLTYQERSVVPGFFGHAPISFQAVSTMRILH
jgi:Flp pilus assembly protein TadG